MATACANDSRAASNSSRKYAETPRLKCVDAESAAMAWPARASESAITLVYTEVEGEGIPDDRSIDLDVFVVRLDPDGKVAWGRTFGSSRSDQGEAVEALLFGLGQGEGVRAVRVAAAGRGEDLVGRVRGPLTLVLGAAGLRVHVLPPGSAYDPRLEGAARIYPHHVDSGGLFLAKLRRLDGEAPPGEPGAHGTVVVAAPRPRSFAVTSSRQPGRSGCPTRTTTPARTTTSK